MAAFKRCKHQGFTYAKDGYKDIHVVCDLNGEIHKKEYCRTCSQYEMNGDVTHESDKEA